MRKSLLFATFAAAAISSTAQATTTTFSSAAAFNAATTGVTTTNFEGTTSTNWILQSGSYSSGPLTITQSTNNAFLVDPSFTTYYYNWGTGDVIQSPANGVLTVTFANAVTAFGLDLGAFYDDGLPSTPAGAASTLYGRPLQIGTAQGNFTVNTATTQTMTFFGVTSDTAFNSFTITGLAPTLGASFVFDNVRTGSAAAATGAVPEPATWAMMLLGFGVVGGAMRRRRTTTRVRFAV